MVCLLGIKDSVMKIENAGQLVKRRCVPCRGGVPKYTFDHEKLCCGPGNVPLRTSSR